MNNAAFSRRYDVTILSLHLLIAVILLSTVAGCQQGSAGPKPAPVQQEKPQVSTAVTPPVAVTEAVQATPKTPPPPAQTTGPAPKIVFEQVVYDFGNISPGSNQTGQFKFTNKGDALLKVASVRCCCGTACNLSKNDYLPGESGEIGLNFTASPEPGSIRRQITVYTNDPQNQEVVLTIKTNIARVVDFEPKTLKLFLRQENAGCGEITLTSLDGKPFAIKGFSATADALKADFDPSVEATRFVLKPKANLESIKKNMKGRISITLSHPQCNNVDLLFDVLPEFTIEPPQILLLKVEPGKPVKRTVWVLGNYGGDFEIDSVRSLNGIIKVTKKEKVGNRYEIDVEIMPPPREGNNKKLLTDVLIVSIKGGEELSIACRGFY